MFAITAAGTPAFIYARDGNRISRFLLKHDGLVGTHLVTHHTAFLLLPCKTAAGINNGRACFSPNPLAWADISNGPRGTHLTTHVAFGTAIAPPGGQHGAENRGETRFKPDGLKGIGGTGGHTLTAANAPRQKGFFRHRPRRPQKSRRRHLAGSGFPLGCVKPGKSSTRHHGPQKTGVKPLTPVHGDATPARSFRAPF